MSYGTGRISTEVWTRELFGLLLINEAMLQSNITPVPHYGDLGMEMHRKSEVGNRLGGVSNTSWRRLCELDGLSTHHYGYR